MWLFLMTELSVAGNACTVNHKVFVGCSLVGKDVL